MLRLFTDTDTDITPAVAAEYGYRLISMPYSIDAKTVYPYVDFDEFESKKFYDLLRSGVLPTTSAISKERYIEYFEPEFAAGNDILYVHFSRAMTVTFNAMDQAVAELKAKYPGRNFYEIDTKGITTSSYTIVREVGDLFKAGKSLEEVLEWAKTEVDKFAMYFFADGHAHRHPAHHLHEPGRQDGLLRQGKGPHQGDGAPRAAGRRPGRGLQVPPLRHRPYRRARARTGGR